MLGLHEKTPVAESNVAPDGSWDADRVTVLAGLELVAVTVKSISDPELTVWFTGRASAGGSKTWTLTIMVARPFPWAESVTVSETV